MWRRRSLRRGWFWPLIAVAACGDDGSASDAGAPSGDAAVVQDAASSDAAPEAAVGDASTRNDAGGEAGAAPMPFVEPPLDMPQRASESQCILEGTRADALPRMQAESVGGELRFPRAMGMVALPRTGEGILVFEQSGQVRRVDLTTSPPTSQLVLDLSGNVVCCDGGGLRGLALHPEYEDNGFVFVHYVVEVAGVRRARVARFTANPSSHLIDPASERNLLELPMVGTDREGGSLVFDATGMLIVALGDGGENPLTNANRRPTALLGSILRIDVAELDATGSYAIPPDNPFASAEDGVPPEVFAWGFRDPRFCDVDRTTGELWCGDRGPTYSEVNQVIPNRHYGWPEVEANICVATGRFCTDHSYEPPLASYRHFEGHCGVASGVIHQTGDPLLDGVVLHADACSGALSGFALRGEQAAKSGRMGLVAQGARAIATGDDGALVIDGEGALWRLRVAPDGVPGTFPQRLSETGCYADLSSHQLTSELIEFRIRSPLWSDASIKRRFMFLPQGAHVDAPAEGPWTYPVGTILAKQFAFQFDDRDPESVHPVETRFMIKRADGWEFHGYAWNDDRTDAVLVTKDTAVDLELMRDGERVNQSYQLPGIQTCPICHAGAPGRALGPRTEQLNRMVQYAGQDAASDQLRVLSDLGLFEMPPGPLPALPDPSDESLPLEARVRSYLHANCAHCHRPEGWSSPDLTMDLRYGLTLQDAHICGEPPLYFRTGTSLIEPGAPEQSAILIRMRDTGLDRMPPVATTVVDPLAERLLVEWIEELTGCP